MSRASASRSEGEASTSTSRGTGLHGKFACNLAACGLLCERGQVCCGYELGSSTAFHWFYSVGFSVGADSSSSWIYRCHQYGCCLLYICCAAHSNTALSRAEACVAAARLTGSL